MQPTILLSAGSHPRKCKGNTQKPNDNVWIGTLKQHEETCNFTFVLCPNQCGEMIQRYKVSAHTKNECLKRSITCWSCRKVGPYDEITYRHECPMRIIYCENYDRGCRVYMHRCRAEEHRVVCPYQFVRCKYEKDINCTFSTMRKNSEMLKQHEADSDSHLVLALETIKKLKQ